MKLKVCDYYLCMNQRCPFLKNQRDIDNKIRDITQYNSFEEVIVRESWYWENSYKVCEHTKCRISDKIGK